MRFLNDVLRNWGADARRQTVEPLAKFEPARAAQRGPPPGARASRPQPCSWLEVAERGREFADRLRARWRELQWQGPKRPTAQLRVEPGGGDGRGRAGHGAGGTPAFPGGTTLPGKKSRYLTKFARGSFGLSSCSFEVLCAPSWIALFEPLVDRDLTLARITPQRSSSASPERRQWPGRCGPWCCRYGGTAASPPWRLRRCRTGCRVG